MALLAFVIVNLLKQEDSCYTDKNEILKSLGLIMYIIGHLMNMIILSIIEFNAKQSPDKNDRVCSWNQSWILLVTMLINPFTYNFFNPVLDHFLCRDLSRDGHIVQLVYSFAHLTFASLIFFAVIRLEQSSFLKLFELDTASTKHGKQLSRTLSAPTQEVLLNTNDLGSDNLSQARPAAG